ncbi:SagB family peptide dehydrogenase [Kutzneria viridogrisea]|uniref:Uncharacterized protein n=2 Tax=Kutzneria TaxID=43356 RepID=W5W711_9PSEU|nr:SagB family peptide dehydrogenase [Kutzneria albida]AHH96963.1 hypothetical protein KALB_3599 [Kutzneria albida DSM 43870]MBA8932072.1 SagB-type dehydrogenase family enzyme [Kutzneria viridogrisea]
MSELVTERTGLREVVLLRPGVHCAVSGNQEVFLVAKPFSQSFGQLDAGESALLRALAAPCDVADLLADDGYGSHHTVRGMLERLRDGGWLTTEISWNGEPVYTLLPQGTGQVATGDPLPSSCTLSRFAVLRREGDRMLLESPVAGYEVTFHDPGALAWLGALTMLSEPGRAEPVPSRVGRRLLADLWCAGLLVPRGEAEQMRSAQWSTHELWFHHISNRSAAESGGRFGGTYWARRHFDPLPGRRPPFGGPLVDLPRPDLDRLRREDITLTEAIEARKSVREHDDDAPLTAAQLGELLYRCARVRGAGWHGGQEVSDRPHPTGGSVHELEIYPLVRKVDGLEPGLYHYDAYEHRLNQVPAHATSTRALLNWAGAPQVLFVITTRFGRVMWKYQGMGYSLTLKNVGVLYQTLYLVATAMGLAPCALALGGNEYFAEATGIDQMVEAGVGAFCVGSVPQVAAPSQESVR